MIFTPRIPPGTPPPSPNHDGQPPPLARRNQKQETRTQKHEEDPRPPQGPNPSHPPQKGQPTPQKRANGEKAPPTVGRLGGSGGRPPGRALRAPGEAQMRRA